MPGDPLGVLERPAVRQIRRDPGRPEGVAAGRGREIRGHRAPLDHGQDEMPRQRPARQPPPRGVDALEERRLRLVELGRLEVVLKRLGRPMVAWLRSGRERLPPPPTATAPVVDSTRACSRPPRIPPRLIVAGRPAGEYARVAPQLSRSRPARAPHRSDGEQRHTHGPGRARVSSQAARFQHVDVDTRPPARQSPCRA